MPYTRQGEYDILCRLTKQWRFDSASKYWTDYISLVVVKLRGRGPHFDYFG